MILDAFILICALVAFALFVPPFLMVMAVISLSLLVVMSPFLLYEFLTKMEKPDDR